MRHFVGDRGGSDQFNRRRSPVRQFAGVLICCVVTFGVNTSVRQFVGVPICCVERWNLIRRLAGRRSPVAGTPICCVERWNLIRRLAGRRSPVAGTPICCVERWNLIRRLAGRRSPVAGRRSPVAGRRYTKFVLSKHWKLLLRRYAASPASSSVASERYKFGVRNQETADELNDYFRSLH